MKNLEQLWGDYVDKMISDELFESFDTTQLLELKKAFVGGIHQAISTLLQADSKEKGFPLLHNLMKEEQAFWDNPTL